MNITKELETVIKDELNKRFIALAKASELPKPPADIARATQRLKQIVEEYNAARSQMLAVLRKHNWTTKEKNIQHYQGYEIVEYYQAQIPQFETGRLIALPVDFYGIRERQANWVAKKYAAIAVKLQYGKSVDVEAILKEIKGLTL